MERQPEWAGICELIYCKPFRVCFQSLEGAVIIRLTIYRSLGWGSSSLPQVVGSRKSTYINPGLGERRNERPFVLQLCKQSRGRGGAEDNGGGGRVPQFRGGGKHLPSQARPCTDPRHEAMGSALGLLSQPPQLRFLQQSVREPRPSPCFVFPFRVSSHVPPSRAGQCHSALELPALLRQLLPVS